MNLIRDTGNAFVNLSKPRHRGILLEGCAVPYIEIESENSFKLIIASENAAGFHVVKVNNGKMYVSTYTDYVPPSPHWENL